MEWCVGLAGAAVVAVGVAGCGDDGGGRLMGATAVWAGGSSACALLADHTVRCWGDNVLDRVGGQPIRSTVPVAFEGLSGVVAMAPAGDHTCALLDDGTAQCWGDDLWGQLGNGSAGGPIQVMPQPVVGLTGAVAIVAMGAVLYPLEIDSFNCALGPGGTVQCWGENSAGEIGLGPTTGIVPIQVPTPQPVVGLARVSALGLGSKHACGVLDDGGVVCWGNNFGHPLGPNGPPGGDNSPSPIVIAGLAGPAVAVTGGASHTCALLRDTTVQCWGFAISGQLGNGVAESQSLEPVTVVGLDGVRQLSSGPWHVCALRDDGTVWCWGQNGEGELGGGAMTVGSSTPVQVADVATATAISAGHSFTCALLAVGQVQCWGANANGELGNGSVSVGKPGPPSFVAAGKGGGGG